MTRAQHSNLRFPLRTESSGPASPLLDSTPRTVPGSRRPFPPFPPSSLAFASNDLLPRLQGQLNRHPLVLCGEESRALESDWQVLCRETQARRRPNRRSDF